MKEARSLTIFIEGRPKPQPRANWSRKTNRMYTPASANPWKKLIAAELKEAWKKHCPIPAPTPIAVEATFLMPRPKRLKTLMLFDAHVQHAIRPDLDNLVKAMMDAMTWAEVWKDDCQACEVTASKWYADFDENTGLFLSISWEATI